MIINYYTTLFIILSSIFSVLSNPVISNNENALNKRSSFSNAVSTAKSIYSEFSEYMSDTDSWYNRKLRNKAKLQGDCGNINSDCNIVSNQIAGNHGKWFIVLDKNGNEQAQCTVRGLTAGPLEYKLNKLTNRMDYTYIYDDHVIDMNGRLACGCYDKNGKWNDISDVQHVHIYGYQENTNSREFEDAFKQLENKIDGTVIDHNNDFGFTMNYNAGNRNLPIRMVFEIYDRNVWSYGNNGQKTEKWNTLKNICVSRYKKNTSNSTNSTSTPRSDNRCGSSYGNASCHTGYCCSKYGYCGKSKDHCGSGCQGKFGKCS